MYIEDFMRVLGFATVLICSCLFCISAKAGITVEHLKVEYEHEPLGIETGNPRFSWQMKVDDGRRGCYQKAYRITVSDESGKTVWDSGKTGSDESLNIRYDGLPLSPETRYDWILQVWDQDNERHSATSCFETGLMQPDRISSAWNGAQWIGSNDLVLYAHYLPVYKVSCTLQFDESSGTTKAAFVYGANDYRLMDKNKNIYNIESKYNESYIAVEIDAGNLKKNGIASLNVYRVGYHPSDKKDVPFKSFEIPLSVLNKDNSYQKHRLYINSVYGYTQIYINGREKQNLVAELNLNPLGQGGDFITFPVLGEIGFQVWPGMKASFSDIEIKNYRMPSNTLYSDKHRYDLTGGHNGILRTKNVNRNAAPMLRTVFNSESSGRVTKARLYITARGIYEVYINGKRVGNDYFNPGLSQYNKTHFYHVYDVTSLIGPGKNAIGAILSEGWWSGGITYRGDAWNLFGDRQSLLAKLVVTYSDGKEKIVTTRPDSWKCYSEGPVTYGSFFQGEVYNAGREDAVRGWCTASYDDSRWKNASVIPLAGNTAPAVHHGLLQNEYDDMRLMCDIGPSPRKIKELSAVSVKEVRPGVYIYDMGQNMVGVPLIKLTGCESGKKITLRFAEILYPDLPQYEDNKGMLMLENIRGAMAQDIYITRGGEETINPRFTFHGYRYVEITGISSALPVSDVKGEVISSVHHLASNYESSNESVNKLWKNITWSTYGNFLSIPTDCPQRNERMGWSGDISVFSRTATYLADVQPFLKRHIKAMSDVQRSDGRFADVAPVGGGFGGVLWGSAGITVAWENYMQYNDRRSLSEHYDAMKDYIDFLYRKNIDRESGIFVQDDPGAWGNLGDWLSPEDDRNDKTLLWEAYFIYDLELMAKIASVLNKKEDEAFFKKLYEERKSFFNKTYIDVITGKTIHSGGKQFSKYKTERGDLVDSQTSYVLPLAFDLPDKKDRSKILENLVGTVIRENKTDDGIDCIPYSLMTGFIGTAWINVALSANGRSDIAYRLLQQDSYPSWLYPVKQGATTIWERLNSYTRSNGFGGNNQMNSFNHYSFGAVGYWLYSCSLGIERDENYPGFKHFILKPEPDPTGKMTYARGYYDSMYGRIESSWKVEGTKCHYKFTIPANTTAILYLETLYPQNVKKGEVSVSSGMEGVTFKGRENGKYVYELSSGVYDFTVQ